MKIGIDARLLERKMTGIGRVLFTLLKDLPLCDKENKYYLFTYEPLNLDKNFYVNISTVKSFIPQKLFSPIWGNLILPYYLKKHKIQILFSVNQIIPLIKVRGCKYISIVHDVIYKADPNFLPFIYRRYLQFFAYFSIKISDMILTVSEYSKQEILNYYKVPEKKIKVVFPSVNKDFKPMNFNDAEKKNVKKSFGLPNQIVLYVGMIENRKNIYGILKIADKLKNLSENIGIVLVGKIGYGGNKIMAEVKKKTNVIHLSNIDDSTLKKLFNVADVFLFPSLYEGFGYPPLEAMQSGLPVVASNNTSLKEIIGNGGIKHKADDYDSMLNDIIKLLNDKVFYDEMRKRGLEQSKKFSGERTVNEIVEVFNSFNNKS